MSDIRDVWALIKGLLCLQEDGKMNVRTAVFWLMFHRTEANDDTFYVTRWLVQLLKAIQVPHMVMARRAWCSRTVVSLTFPILSVPLLPPMCTWLWEGENGSKENCLVN